MHAHIGGSVHGISCAHGFRTRAVCRQEELILAHVHGDVQTHVHPHANMRRQEELSQRAAQMSADNKLLGAQLEQAHAEGKDLAQALQASEGAIRCGVLRMCLGCQMWGCQVWGVAHVFGRKEAGGWGAYEGGGHLSKALF